MTVLGNFQPGDPHPVVIPLGRDCRRPEVVREQTERLLRISDRGRPEAVRQLLRAFEKEEVTWRIG